MSESPEPLARASFGEDTAPPVYHYRVSAPLLDDLARQISVARGTVGMDGALIGSFAWQMDFRTQQIEAVQTLLAEWAKAHLPLMVTVERVEALVEGTQRYLAAFALEPAETLQEAQQALQQALAGHIEALSADFAFAPRLPIADEVSAAQFPKLIHMLQLNFDPVEWEIRALELLHAPLGDARWEVLESFHA